MAKLVII